MAYSSRITIFFDRRHTKVYQVLHSCGVLITNYDILRQTSYDRYIKFCTAVAYSSQITIFFDKRHTTGISSFAQLWRTHHKLRYSSTNVIRQVYQVLHSCGVLITNYDFLRQTSYDRYIKFCTAMAYSSRITIFFDRRHTKGISSFAQLWRTHHKLRYSSTDVILKYIKFCTAVAYSSRITIFFDRRHTKVYQVLHSCGVLIKNYDFLRQTSY